jgi:hypothetical protein
MYDGFSQDPVYPDYIEIICSPDWNDELGDYGDYEDVSSRTLKVMLWQDTSVTTSEYEFVTAPEGTVFEPYTVTFQHAKVEKIESLGKNLAYKQYGIKSEGGTVDATKLKIDDTNKHCYSMIQVIGGKKYTISKSGSTDGRSAFRFFYFDREPILDETQSIGGGYIGNYAKYTLTAPENAKYLYVRWTEDDEKYPCGDVQIEYGDTATEYKPYTDEPIDTYEIPEDVINRDGYGREGSSIEFRDDDIYLVVTKDENLEPLPTPEETIITSDFFSGDSAGIPYIKVQGGGRLRFVNSLNKSVPSSVWYTVRRS